MKPNPVAVAERNAAIADVMRRMEADKADLRRFLIATQDAHTADEQAILVARNRQFRGYLYDLLADFMELSLEDKLAALAGDTFQGMAWQSLIASHPYVYHPRWGTLHG